MAAQVEVILIYIQVQLPMRGIKRKPHAQKMSEGHEWQMLSAILKANTV